MTNREEKTNKLIYLWVWAILLNNTIYHSSDLIGFISLILYIIIATIFMYVYFN